MADTVIGTGTLPDGGNFQIYLDGISTYKQSERMISKLDALVKRFKATEQQDAKDKKEREEERDNLKDKNKKTKDYNKNLDNLNESTLNLYDAQHILRGDLFGLAQAGVNTSKSIIGLGIAVSGFNTLIGALTQYSAQLGQAMQRGVAGDVMTFAIASKTAGITLGQFNKALSESGGSFAALGSNATDGAKNFASLIAQVRTATKSMGNFGLTNEEMANFVAQQTKFAVAQGFKGKKAEEVVLKNTVQLGEGFQDLAERTGRTIKEMADAAAKLSMDPVVASFVKSAGAAGPDVSAAIAKLAGDFAGIFGEAGNKIAEDLTKTGLGNLPFVMTQSGKNMLLASNSVYTEMERQANMARNGIKTTEADQERLRQVVQQEVAMRGEELRTLANLPGPMGDAARQILQLSVNAEQANNKEGKEAKKRADNAKAFVGAVNDLQAKLQELAIPFLQLINGIDWTFMFSVLSSFASTVKFLLTPLEWLGSLLGASGVGTVIGGLIAVAGVASMLMLGFSGLAKAVTFATSGLADLAHKAGVAAFRSKDLGDYKALRRAGYDRKEAAGMIRQERQDKYIGRAKEAIPFAAVAAGTALVGVGLTALGEKLKESYPTVGGFIETVGNVSTILGTWSAILAPIVTTLFPGLVTSVQAYIVANGGVIGALKAFTLGIFSTLKSYIIAHGGVIGALKAVGLTITTALGGFVTAIKTAALPAIAAFKAAILPLLIPFAKIILVISAVIGVGWLLYKGLQLMWEGVKLVGSGLAMLWQGITAAGAFIWEGFKSVIGWIGSGIKGLWDIITSPFTMLFDWFKNSWIGKMLGLSDKAEDKKSSRPATAASTPAAKSQADIDREEAARSGRMGLKAQHEQWAKDSKQGTGYKESRGQSEWNKMAPGATVINPDGTRRQATLDEVNAAKRQAAVPADQTVVGGGKDIMKSQTSAVEASDRKASEEKTNNQKMVGLLEDIKTSNEAGVGVQAKGVAIADNSNRYLRNQTLYSGQ